MTTSEKVFQLYKDYNTAKTAFSICHKNTGDILEAVTSRIEADRAQVRERAVTLKAQISDGTRAATVRRMAELELAQIQERTFSATADETKLFENELSAAETAIDDMGTIRREIRTAVDAANAELTKIRTATVGDQDSGLQQRWIDSERASFSARCIKEGTI